jgi:cysteine-rich repeat protein
MLKSFLAAATAFATALAATPDLLFVDTLQGLEISEATTLGFTTQTVTEAEWKSMTTQQFAQYKAIIIADEFGSSDLTMIQFLADTANTWGPAITGNIILLGADPSNHGKTVLIDNSIQFAVAGQGTGFYFALSQMYDQIAVSNVPALSYFGNFTVEGQLSCYDEVHIEASSPAINTLTDAYLSNWGCSVHEAFSDFPTTGLLGFQTIAIADGVVAPGTLSYADGHTGLPYIITRGATPSGCGDGAWQSQYGEECDDGSKNGTPGDPCSISCKCLSGKPKGDGTCYPANNTVPYPPTTGKASGAASGSPKPSGYFNSSTIAITSLPPYPTYSVTVVPPPMICIGIEIIVSVTVVESCSTIAPGNTITYTTTSACGTYQKPIYNTPIPEYPCYVCACNSQGIPTNQGFITATTTYCPSCPTEVPATVYPCPTCYGTTLTTTCPWQTTPVWSMQGAVQYTSYSVHPEHAPCSTCGGPTPQPTAAYTYGYTPALYTPTATPSVVLYTGSAARTTDIAVKYLGAVAGFAALMVMML